MTWADWGDLGSILGGTAAVVLALFALGSGGAIFRDWRAKLSSEAHAAE